MNNLQEDINNFISERVIKEANKHEQSEEYKEIQEEVTTILNKLQAGIKESFLPIIDDLVEAINTREFTARKQSYKQGLMEAELIRSIILGK